MTDGPTEEQRYALATGGGDEVEETQQPVNVLAEQVGQVVTKALDGNWTGDPELAVFLLEGPYPKAERERLIKLVELTDIGATPLV